MTQDRPKIMAGIASIPERAGSLAQTVASLAPHVDRLAISLNDYPSIPTFLQAYPNVSAIVRTDNAGDAEKFAAVDEWDGVVLGCDDDLLYPPDYVPRLLDGLHRHGYDAIVGFHGGTTLGWNGAHGAASEKKIRCLGTLAADDTDVNVLGTGALAYHTAAVPIWRELFRHANMADVHLACHAHRFGIPMVALEHQAGWLKDICPAAGRRIYESNRDGDGSPRDTRALRRAELDRHDWTAAPARPRVRVSIATCERPDLLYDLLGDLVRESRWVDLEVAIFDDASEDDYSQPRALAEEFGWEWHTSPERLGKLRHCELVNAELEACRGASADWFVFLPDDVRLVRHALPRAIETWSRLEDPSTLTLWRLMDHEGLMNWTGRFPEQRDHAWEVFHVDGIYLADRATLETLDYQCHRRVPRYGRRRLQQAIEQRTSSGVGRAMSLHLHAKGRRMYRVDKSLAIPVGAPSVMNPNVGDRRYPGLVVA